MIQSGNTFARLWSQVKVACFDILIGAGNTVATKISHGFELLLKGRDNVIGKSIEIFGSTSEV